MLASIVSSLVANIIWVIMLLIIAFFAGCKSHERLFLVYKSIMHWIKDSSIIWNGNINYKFTNLDNFENLDLIIDKIYNHPKLKKMNIKKLDPNSKLKILNCMGTLFYLKKNEQNSSFYIEIGDTKTKYKILKDDLKNGIIKNFLEIVEKTLIENNQLVGNFKPKYSITLKFENLKDNFYLTHWVKGINQEEICSFNVQVCDKEKEKMTVEYSIKDMRINVLTNLNDFLAIAEKFALKAV